jgi:hypothetical protein
MAFDIHNAKPEDLSPQTFESNDSRFRVEIVDEDFFELTFYHLEQDDVDFFKEENRTKFCFGSEDRDRLIAILEESKKINPYAWKTLECIREENLK